MINEIFLKSASNIRREYLKLTSDLSKYREDIKNVESNLNELTSELQKIDNNYTEEKIKKMISYFDVLESESDKILKIVEPLNSKLEKLSNDEYVLYQNICSKYPELTEEDIVAQVTERLKLENLL
jgi:hypothetical protein